MSTTLHIAKTVYSKLSSKEFYFKATSTTKLDRLLLVFSRKNQKVYLGRAVIELIISLIKTLVLVTFFFNFKNKGYF